MKISRLLIEEDCQMEEAQKSNKSEGGCIGYIIILVVIICLFRSCDDSNDTTDLNTYSTTICLDYEYVALTTNTPMNIYIDDKEIVHHHKAGDIEAYDVVLSEGVHKICLKNDGIYSTKSIEFEVDKDNVYFEFGAKTSLVVGVEFWLE